jgi:hypothetical protein
VPKHDIWMTFPDKPLKNVDTTIAIWSDGDKLGELHISRGTVDWKSKRKRSAKRLSWERFAELMDAL